MTIEEYNSIKPTETARESTNTVIPALLGSQRMPNFDKLILAPSPQLALTTMYMHARNRDACYNEDSNKVAHDYLG